MDFFYHILVNLATESEYTVDSAIIENINETCRNLIAKALKVSLKVSDDLNNVDRIELEFLTTFENSLNDFLVNSAQLKSKLKKYSKPIHLKNWHAALEKSRSDFRRILRNYTSIDVSSKVNRFIKETKLNKEENAEHYVPVTNLYAIMLENEQKDNIFGSAFEDIFKISSGFAGKQFKLPSELERTWIQINKFRNRKIQDLKTTKQLNKKCLQPKVSHQVVNYSTQLIIAANETILKALDSLLFSGNDLSEALRSIIHENKTIKDLVQSSPNLYRPYSEILDDFQAGDITVLNDIMDTMKAIHHGPDSLNIFQEAIDSLDKSFHNMYKAYTNLNKEVDEDVIYTESDFFVADDRLVFLPTIDDLEGHREKQVAYFQQILSLPAHSMSYLIHAFRTSVDLVEDKTYQQHQLKLRNQLQLEYENLKSDNQRLRHQISTKLDQLTNQEDLKNDILFYLAWKLCVDISKLSDIGVRWLPESNELPDFARNKNPGEDRHLTSKMIKAMQHCGQILRVLLKAHRINDNRKRRIQDKVLSKTIGDGKRAVTRRNVLRSVKSKIAQNISQLSPQMLKNVDDIVLTMQSEIKSHFNTDNIDYDICLKQQSDFLTEPVNLKPIQQE
ncbi:hypothetical protein GJ496_010556 [Pomphorhynchus laevis]|nr:hypothetical protein GJ496_010556 [Pomphorhynchus laevis]